MYAHIPLSSPTRGCPEMSREEPDLIESEFGYTAENDPHAEPRKQSPELAIVFKEFGFWLQRGVS